MSAPGVEVPADAVEAEILYLSPTSTLNRRYVAPGIDVNTGQFEPHRVVIRNGRPFQNEFTHASHGFVLAQDRSRSRSDVRSASGRTGDAGRIRVPLQSEA